MRKFGQYELIRSLDYVLPNWWDTIVLIIVLLVTGALIWGSNNIASPLSINEAVPISLSPAALPGYTLNTVVRMFVAMAFSLLFTFIVAPLAAKNSHIERFMIPAIDIAQSIPVLGMQAIAVTPFLTLFNGKLIGAECAAIFAIFTAQVWNMVLSLYQSLKMVPNELLEVAKIYRLNAWQRFWRVEVPYGTPSLLWNTMMSMSAGWFFVVATEAIFIANQQILLPGIGSYISVAIKSSNILAIFYAIAAMLVVIILYDQLLFRPLLAWTGKFQSEIDEDNAYYESWLFSLLAKTSLLKKVRYFIASKFNDFIHKQSRTSKTKFNFNSSNVKQGSLLIFYLSIAIAILVSIYYFTTHILINIELPEILYVAHLGLITTFKVFALIIISSLIWVPCGVFIGLKPSLCSFFQPIIQFLAAFPANLFYPFIVILIVKNNLHIGIWTTPLMILGTQWYILFNVIAGTAAIPKDLKLAALNLGVKGKLWWQKLILPAIFPNYITGAMAAAGGCWNASVVAEAVQWGDSNLIAKGLGSYVTEYTRAGDFQRVALGITIMALYVMLFNQLLWQKLYRAAETRFAMN